MPPDADDKSNVLRFRGRIAAALGEPQPDDPPAIDVTGGGPHPPGMEFNERLARVEAAIDGLRHSQNLTIGATVGVGAIVAAFIIGFGVYTLQRVDQTQATISTEAAQTRQERIGITTAISNAITATKQAQPQIVVVPTPAPANPPR